MASINFQVLLCNNNTRENLTEKCKSREIIEETISTLYFNILYPDVFIDVKNSTSPINKIIKLEYFSLSTKMSKMLMYNLQDIIIKSDFGIIFNEEPEEIHQLAFLNLDKDYNIQTGENLDYIFDCGFFLSNIVTTYNRTYIKLQYIFANLGGIIQIVLLAINIIFGQILKKKFNVKILNNLFDFDDENVPITKIHLSVKKIPIVDRQNIINNESRNFFGINMDIKKNGDSSKDEEFKSVFKNDQKSEYSGDIKSNVKLTLNNFKSKFNLFNKDKKSLYVKDENIKEKINIIAEMKKRKLRYSYLEIISSLIFMNKCLSKKSVTKNAVYEIGKSSLTYYGDYITMLKQIQDLSKLKYLTLDSTQLLAFPYLSKPKKTSIGFEHKVKDYAKAFDVDIIHKERITELYNVYDEKKRTIGLTEADDKIINILDERIKDILI
jgi:hypothetical protein